MGSVGGGGDTPLAGGETERKETVMEAEGRLSRPIHHGGTRGSKSNRTWGRRGREEDKEEEALRRQSERRTEGREEDLGGGWERQGEGRLHGGTLGASVSA